MAGLFLRGYSRGKSLLNKTSLHEIFQQGTIHDIEREVRTALAELDSAKARMRAMLVSVSQAEEALRDEQLKHESGRSAINFVLDAEAALLTNRAQLKQGQRSIAIASLLLDLSPGRIRPASGSRP